MQKKDTATRWGDPPFEHLRVSGPYDAAKGRKYMFMRIPGSAKNKGTTTMSHARYLMCVKENRVLERWEEADHIDGNPSNDSLDNLQILDKRKHRSKTTKQLGQIEHKKRFFNCKQCKKNFIRLDNHEYIYCSDECRHRAAERTEWPSKEELEKLVWSIPCSRLAPQLGVSDKAIEKRCKKLGISKPPRGYWAGR